MQTPPDEKPPLATRVKLAVFGAPRNLFDPKLFHNLSLIAFFAWVGLGADGISSSCYGPEEAFLALGRHTSLAVFVALATVITVFIISGSYMQIIEMFPSGGGGYIVASKLLGPPAGVVSGSALVIDYVLTITISVASGTDAVFSFCPPSWIQYKFPFVATIILFLLWINLRGVKESVAFLTPIFIAFMVTHVPLVFYIFGKHIPDLPQVASAVGSDVSAAVREVGWFGVVAVVMKAYSLGAGTFTGIEAVSNSMQTLREPRIQTGRKAMAYIAISLSVVAGGILIGYLLSGVHHIPGKTLNAILLEKVAGGLWGASTAPIVVAFVLAAEAALLFVAAQTGFIDGPQVLSSMAVDSYLPHRFAHLSQRLVRKFGVGFMGLMAFLMLYITGGSVQHLVVMYSINVFITFSLSQFGMCVHWWKFRNEEKRWKHGIIMNGVGFLLTFSILCVTILMKFTEGGWITLVITGLFVGLCFLTRAHYRSAAVHLQRLDELLTMLPETGTEKPKPMLRKTAPTAVVLVSGYNGLGMHVFFSIVRSFPGTFKNYVFISAGVVDSTVFKGVEEIDNLVSSVRADLAKYEAFVHAHGYYAETRYQVGTDVVEVVTKIAREVAADFPNSVFFSGQLLFQDENFFTRLLHNQTSFMVQKRFVFEGLPMIIMPVRVL
ncbi:MAG TPA: APC family permease [Candidatus Deferrimicrobiaceae bacterium]|jgi:amino acid transporter